jgi:outer membrane biosynthesis protein TonB
MLYPTYKMFSFEGARTAAGKYLALFVVASVELSTPLVATQPLSASPPRLRDAVVPALPVQAYGGGEVMLELMVAPNGSVTAVEALRTSPPFTELVTQAASAWRFSAGTTLVDGRVTPVSAPVLVVASFRAPTIYAAPAPGALPASRGAPSARVPQLASLLTAGAYPPNARGDAVVIVEIEMTRLAAVRGYRIASPPSGFDAAALDAARAWRFAAPRATDVPDRLYVYGVLGFRHPVVQD